MKASQRHKLKQNEFEETLARTKELVTSRQQELTRALIAAVVVLVAIGGYYSWRNLRESRATNLLAEALTVAHAQVVTPPAPAPGSPPPVQPPGTFRTEQERLTASIPKLQAAADAYPNSQAGITARFRLAASLAALGRFGEAEQRYQEVVQKTGRSDVYHNTARLGMGAVEAAQGKTDAAIATFKELSTDSTSQLPLDGVLMQLGRAAAAGGKTDEATRAFTRVVDEFPQSMYVSEAREQLAGLKKA